MSKIGERQLEIMRNGGATKGPIDMDWDLLKEVEAQIKEENGENPITWNARAVLYFNENFDEAINSLSEALALDPFNGNYLYNRGRKFLSQDRYVQALSDFAMAVRLDDKDAWKWHFGGMAFFLEERYEEAIEWFYKALLLHEKNETGNTPPEVDWIWTSYMKLGDKEKAQEVLKYIDKDTEVERGDLMYKKRVLLFKGDMTLEEFEKEIEYDVSKRAITELYGAAAYCYYLKDDVENAIKYLDELLKYDTNRHAFGYKLALKDRDEWAKELKK